MSIPEASRVSVTIEPDSPEMEAQSLLKACKVEGDGRVFTIGRRGSKRYVTIEENAPDHLIANEYPFTISRRHCEIECVADEVFVRDLNSRLGTIVNDQRLGAREGQQQEISLKPGVHSLVLGRRGGNVRFRLIVRMS